MGDTVKMPKELTAENGAKGLLSGEFKEAVTFPCPECSNLDEPNEDCMFCDGEATVKQSVTVSWSTIKDIYAMAVKHLEVKDN